VYASTLLDERPFGYKITSKVSVTVVRKASRLENLYSARVFLKAKARIRDPPMEGNRAATNYVIHRATCFQGHIISPVV
jgi:hypothetical protein